MARPVWKAYCRANKLRRGHKGVTLSKFVR